MANFDLALNRLTHDLAITKDASGLIDLILIDGESAEGVAQEIKMSLLLWAKEWFLDTSVGLDYVNQIFIKGADMSTIQALISATIAAVPHVIAVDYINLTPIAGTRQLQVDWGAATDYGYINRSTAISGGN